MLASALTAGCVLLVSPPEGGETCLFGVSNTLCGACVVERCRDAVNDCCADRRCRDRLPQLEDCARNANASCDAFKQLSAEEAEESAGAALSLCVQRECPGRCEAVGTSLTNCTDLPASARKGCSCRYGGVSNPQICSPLEYLDTLCCAPEGWPAPGQECSCMPIGCQPSPDGCICSLVDYANSATARTCEGTICCAADDTCVCGTTPCTTHQKQVERCSLEVLSCPRQQNRFWSCSVHEP